MKTTRPAISDAERAVLKVLWEQGQGTVREIQQSLDRLGQAWKRSTVITLLQRLEKKGYVASDKRSFAFVFRAAASRDDVLHQRMTVLAQELSDGSPTPLVLAFAKRHHFTADEIEQFRSALDQLESKPDRRKKASR